ncbi:mediator of RNA polymerase II transcription subunit 16-like [Oppia nitens]|uniref:mediator of RNA polymerase II transcription subunit 16-like n=1 Tax=Oppia nitens TaxID=1686743 RepID=UPI0023DA7E92|nr:mediator of RNA polymerase II transcription subunit 16-like [Oppia nitens]
MDQIYSVLRHNSSVNNGFTECVSQLSPLCCISSGNIMAFTSTTDLSESVPKWMVFHVYVVDLNIPYNPYKVSSHLEEITALEWDISGTKLLIGDVTGNIELWSMKDYLISEWYLLHVHQFCGERILSSIWFHNGIKIGINYDKKDINVSYLDKYTHTKFAASVRQFGGKPTEGYLAISSSGLVCASLFLSDGTVVSGTEILGHFRSKLKRVDVCYAKNGDFLVVATNGCADSSINCYGVTVKINASTNPQEKQRCQITCQAYTSFYMSCSKSLTTDAYRVITHLKFVLREAAEAVVIAASGANGSTVELWELREKTVSIHKMFQNKTNNNNNDMNNPVPGPKTVVWQHNTSSSANSSVVSIATPRLSLFDTSPPPSYILVAFKDNTIKCFYRENLHLVVILNIGNIHNRNLDSNKSFGMQKALTTQPSMTTISDMQFTWSSCAMVAIDSLSQIYVYKLSPITDPGGAMNPNYAQTMLEYCLVSGNDWWDVIVSLKPNLIESVCERITESFMNKQQLEGQQKWLSRFLTIKASLYRCLNNSSANNSGQCKAGDFYTLIMLNAIATTLKSLLRPRDNHENEGPAENLSLLIQNKGNDLQFMNVDKILMNLENKDFCVEPQILQSFQHLHQWIADLTLFLLASLPQQYHHNQFRFPGGGLIFDTKALNTLRELLVIIRFWGLINSGCLPIFTKMQDNLDVISLLFKLLSKTVTENLDESLLDECCLLPNQVLIPQLNLCLKAIGIASPALYSNVLPLQFEYFIEPSFLKFTAKTHLIDGAVNCYAGRRLDVVRYVGLGAINQDTSNLRSCSRCNSVSLLKPIMRSPATRAWDQRWIKNCLCGGHWRVNQFNNNLHT